MKSEQGEMKKGKTLFKFLVSVAFYNLSLDFLLNPFETFSVDITSRVAGL